MIHKEAWFHTAMQDWRTLFTLLERGAIDLEDYKSRMRRLMSGDTGLLAKDAQGRLRISGAWLEAHRQEIDTLLGYAERWRRLLDSMFQHGTDEDLQRSEEFVNNSGEPYDFSNYSAEMFRVGMEIDDLSGSMGRHIETEEDLDNWLKLALTNARQKLLEAQQFFQENRRLFIPWVAENAFHGLD